MNFALQKVIKEEDGDDEGMPQVKMLSRATMATFAAATGLKSKRKERPLTDEELSIINFKAFLENEDLVEAYDERLNDMQI